MQINCNSIKILYNRLHSLVLSKTLSPFLKSVTILASGTLISQFLLFATTPIMSRIYTPNDFGQLAIFGSICLIFGVITTGKYELAIVLPQNEKDAWLIIIISITLSSFFCIIYFLIIQIYFDTICNILKLSIKDSNCLHLVPLAIFVTSLWNQFILLLHRKMFYTKVAIVTVVQTTFLVSTNLFLKSNYFNITGLIWGSILGQFVGVLFMLFFFRKDFPKSLSLAKIKALALQYSSFPKFTLWFHLVNTLSQQIIPVLFSLLYSTTIVGFFSIANRILKAPFLLFVGSIGNVFKNDAIKLHHENKDLTKLYVNILKRLFVISFFLFSTIAFVCPYLFSTFLGKKWTSAGIFGQLMCLMLFSEIIETPLNFVYILKNKQKQQLIIQIINVIGSVTVVWIGFAIYNNSFISIALLSFFTFIVNCISIFIMYKFTSCK